MLARCGWPPPATSSIRCAIRESATPTTRSSRSSCSAGWSSGWARSPRSSPREIENLFAADLAYLQDVYGAINFGSQAEIDAVIEDADARAAAARPAPTRGAGRSSRAAAVDERRTPPTDDDGEVASAMAVSRRRHVEEVGRRQP